VVASRPEDHFSIEAEDHYVCLPQLRPAYKAFSESNPLPPGYTSISVQHRLFVVFWRLTLPRPNF
jgi:hypothetical protein